LPAHLATLILSHLPPPTLLLCTLVSRTWRHASLHPLLWQQHCVDEGIGIGPGSEYLLETCEGDLGRWWCAVYRDGVVRRRNWRQGVYRFWSVPVVEVRDSINCFWYDTDKIILGTRRHKLLLITIPTPTLWSDLASLPTPTPPPPHLTFHSAHTVPIMSLALPRPTHTSQHLLASVDGGGTLVLWNVFTGQEIARLAGAHEGGISSVAIVEGGRAVVTAGFDRLVRVHEVREVCADPEDGSEESLEADGTVPSPGASNEDVDGGGGDGVDSQSRTHSLSRRTTPGPRRRRSADTTTPTPTTEPAQGVTRSATLPPHPGRRRRKFELATVGTMRGHTGDVFCMAVVEGEGRVVTGSVDQSVKVWNLADRTLIRSMRGHRDSVTCIAVQDDYAFSGSLDMTIRHWDISTGDCIRTLTAHTKWVKALAVNDDYLVSGGWDECIIVWDWAKGTHLHTLTIDHGPIVCLQFDESKVVAVCRGEGVQHCVAVLEFAGWVPAGATGAGGDVVRAGGAETTSKDRPSPQLEGDATAPEEAAAEALPILREQTEISVRAASIPHIEAADAIPRRIRDVGRDEEEAVEASKGEPQASGLSASSSEECFEDAREDLLSETEEV
ncbi:WD40-repeat-containing domain protein, partial [Fimicolochytrium jonesii]|uniref:WD40-repeat-containing domain protein n=1 Tax=Fimicolochytrium jonesii TaxID=1396493 RepID=UPI0022FDE4A4